MKYFTLCIICLLVVWPMYGQRLDSIQMKKASMAIDSGYYDKAYHLYKDLYPKIGENSNLIKSKKTADLRETYFIDELALQNAVQENRLLKLSRSIFIFLILISTGLVIYIRYLNKRMILTRKKLEQAKLLAEESIRNKSIFLSNMSHEIKTPLNALSGFSEILTLEGITPEERIQYNEIIQLNSELLIKLVDDVVDISCLDISNMDFHIHPCEAVSFSGNVVKTLSAIKQTPAEIIFETNLSELFITTDPSRLQQLLINLIVNATKFTKKGTIVLKLELMDPETALFSVTDTGCGIPPEKQAHIFDRFEKLDELAPGTGLGLSICQLIIQRLNGKIWLDPEYTSGCRFVFTHSLKQEVKR